ncbi:MAG: hypothetical protein HY737_04710 [Candidatus Omnitrophica bacterium]|nr:hypothetical protein [Candidatus Omnitrophota bacterium]
MHRVESYETLAALARSRLAQLEAEQLSAPPEQPLRGDRAGTIGDAYAWDVTAIHREDVSEIRLKVWSPQEQAAQRLTLKAIWPSWWVPENWYTAQ